MKITEQAKEKVKEICFKKGNIFTVNAFNHHFQHVVRYAKILAKQNGANLEIVEIAAWFHDIGAITSGDTDHHLTGAKFARKFLENINYPEQKICQVEHCSVAHRGSQKIPRKSIEAVCLADADAMSHFDEMDSLFNLAPVVKKLSVDEARKFIKEKFGRSYKKLSVKSRKIIEPKYKAAMLLLK